MKSRKNLRRKFFKHLKENLFVYLMAGLAVSYASPLYAAPAPNALPSGGQFVGGSGSITPQGLQMDVVQHQQNAAIKWQQFNVGKDASVNFKSNAGGPFNTLNYVNGGNTSEIYGKLNAQNGNIYLVNPAGVQIGDGAKVNVGSLYVSNKKLDESKLASFNGNNIDSMVAAGQTANAELMSLGDIVSAGKVTFDGDRIVIDGDKLLNNARSELDTTQNLVIKTTDLDNVIIGYAMTKGRGAEAEQKVALAAGSTARESITYSWIENFDQLQAMSNNLAGNYALKNTIDASASKSLNAGKGFKPIGDKSNPFTGRFDGGGHDSDNRNNFQIKNLYINRPNEDNVGLFGYTKGATIGGVKIGKGSSIKGQDHVGAVIGYGENTTINDLTTNYADVEGRHYVGGIIGDLTGTSTINGAILENYGEVKGRMWMSGPNREGGDNVGGIIGNCLTGVKITDSEFENHGKVSGEFSVGGIIGRSQADISGSTFQNGFVGDDDPNEGAIEAYGNDLGGIFGYHETGNIESSEFTNYGTLKNADDNISNVGGIIGTLKTGNKLLKDCKFTNFGKIEMTTSASAIGGIFGENSRNIESSSLRNFGEITISGKSYRIGGVIGDNQGTINNSFLINGDSTGSTDKMKYGFITAKESQYVGGVIGINKSKIQNSSLKNWAKVQGKDRVGGVVGQNYNTSGTGGDWIYGGRDEKDEYYKYQIFNVGAVSGETNVGGIIGENKGILEGAFNLGTVTGTGEAVGGIVGNNQYNTAKVANVFNYGEVKGTDKVGGIIGANPTGSLSDAYNMGTVTGTSNVGNVLGYSESSSNKFERIYATNITGKLIGAQKYKAKITDAYSFVQGDTSIDGVTVIDRDKQNMSESYGSMFESGNWKIYEGYGTPLLKFFLTKATYTGETTLPYNGSLQELSLDNVTAPDPMNGGTVGSIPVDSYSPNPLHTARQSEVGDNYLAFVSDQLMVIPFVGGGIYQFTLGYDIDTTYSIVPGTTPGPNQQNPSAPSNPNRPTPPTPEDEQQPTHLEVYDVYVGLGGDKNWQRERGDVKFNIENGGIALNVEGGNMEVDDDMEVEAE